MAAWPSVAARLLGQYKGVAIGIGRAGVDRVGEDMVHDRWRPGMAARARKMRSCVQTPEDLPDGHVLVGEPAIDHAHQLGLTLVDHEVPRHLVLAWHVPVIVGRTAALVVALAGLLQFAATKSAACAPGRGVAAVG